MALGRAGERVARWDDVVGARGIAPPIPTSALGSSDWLRWQARPKASPADPRAMPTAEASHALLLARGGSSRSGGHDREAERARGLRLAADRTSGSRTQARRLVARSQDGGHRAFARQSSPRSRPPSVDELGPELAASSTSRHQMPSRPRSRLVTARGRGRPWAPAPGAVRPDRTPASLATHRRRSRPHAGSRRGIAATSMCVNDRSLSSLAAS